MADYILIGYTFRIIKYCSTHFTWLGGGFVSLIVVSSGFTYSTQFRLSFTRVHLARIQQFMRCFRVISNRLAFSPKTTTILWAACAWGDTRINWRIYTIQAFHLLVAVVICVCILVTTLVRLIFYCPIVCRLHVTHVCLCDNQQKISGFVSLRLF